MVRPLHVLVRTCTCTCTIVAHAAWSLSPELEPEPEPEPEPSLARSQCGDLYNRSQILGFFDVRLYSYYYCTRTAVLS